MEISVKEEVHITLKHEGNDAQCTKNTYLVKSGIRLKYKEFVFGFGTMGVQSDQYEIQTTNFSVDILPIFFHASIQFGI
jgi:hypothetical protein